MEKLKSMAQVKREHKEYSRLVSAVIDRIGIESIADVNNYGIQCGFGGFIYYTDTHKFAMKFRKLIVQLLEEDAEQLGEGDVIQMVSGFGQFRRSKMDSDDRRELYKYLAGARCEQSTITNLMAWYAAESVCRWFEY